MSNQPPLFNKVLIANRGEIAARVVRACRDLGIRSAVAFAPSDRGSLAVRLADEAYLIPDLDGRAAYLDVARLVALATSARADALHPGYGFLSERAELAEACAAAGVVFIGPSAANIRALGNKNEARRLMDSAQVPLVPGARGAVDSADAAQAVAERLGYPVLIKAAHGGGGRGMRLVRGPQDLASALSSAAHEAQAAFGQGDVYLEKYFERPRHIEVQVAADRHGHVLVFPERECSIQRRFQKMVEESPSSFLTAETRARLMDAARRGAAAVGYQNVGTFEFLVDADQNFYFLEVNTRLQVEHPVTEEVTGIDLVVLQLRLAVGQELPIQQSDVTIRGWAFEARLTCEDPYSDFLPHPGTLQQAVFPQGPGVRIDSGVVGGSVIPAFYDSLIAKLIVHGQDRDEARRRMLRALAECRIIGIPSTVPFHQALFAHPRFAAGDISTAFLSEEMPLALPTSSPQERSLAAVAAALWEAGRLPPAPATSAWKGAARAENLHAT